MPRGRGAGGELGEGCASWLWYFLAIFTDSFTCFRVCISIHIWKEVYSKRKEFSLSWSKVFPFRADPIFRSGQKQFRLRCFPESISTNLFRLFQRIASDRTFFFMQEKFSKLVYTSINLIIKCGVWQPVKVQLVSHFRAGSKLKWFLSHLWINVGNIYSEIG